MYGVNGASELKVLRHFSSSTENLTQNNNQMDDKRSKTQDFWKFVAAKVFATERLLIRSQGWDSNAYLN